MAQMYNEVYADSVFTGVMVGTVDFADVNGDGFEDVLIVVENETPEEIARLYANGELTVAASHQDTGERSMLGIYPNPADEVLYISNQANLRLSHWELFDAYGRSIRSAG